MLGALGLLLAGGCAAPPPAAPRNVLDALEGTLPRDPEHRDYVLARMEFARAALRLGSYARAEPKLREAREQFDVERANTGAALGSEARKYYKGETYERAMLWWYSGYVFYHLGNYEDAERSFRRAVDADRGAVVKKDTPEVYGDDFALAYFWLGKTYARLGRTDQCAIAFRKAAVETPRKQRERELKQDHQAAQRLAKRRADGERWANATFRDPARPKTYLAAAVDPSTAAPPADGAPLACAAPDNPVETAVGERAQLFDAEFQRAANVTAIIELGACPYKELAGMQNERTEIRRPFILPEQVAVYVDGHFAGAAHRLLDLWDQASTQDRIAEKDVAQATKMVAKEVLRRTPYIGFLFGMWDVSGDVRHWTSLPGRVYVFTGRLKPGVHTLRFELRDIAGAPLPRWTNTYYGLRVPESGETCVLLEPRPEADNLLSDEQVKLAVAAGARPGSE
ncbi:MAG: tetratricopeptide repeat protein [Planctomycetota bacterium]